MSDQRTVLVTGANSDIGAELCRYFLDNGDNVIAMVNRSSDNLAELSNRLSEIVKLDFSNSVNVENFIKNRDELLSSIDIFISLASVRKSVNYGSISSSDLISHFTINTIPTILLIQYLGNSMSKKGWGRIVVGSSIGVKFGGGMDTYCYSVTKYATELIPSISKQWYEYNVLVNVVRIGVTDTSKFREIGEDRIEKRVELIPMQRLAKVEEIAKSIYYLGSAENTYITGQIVAVSGGE
jgi:NAD(P)-dependent dehydrogenase (short-subunit alcohol dehydrogenase family)